MLVKLIQKVNEKEGKKFYNYYLESEGNLLPIKPTFEGGKYMLQTQIGNTLPLFRVVNEVKEGKDVKKYDNFYLKTDNEVRIFIKPSFFNDKKALFMWSTFIPKANK